MAEIAKLQIGENSYEFPLIVGTENEVAIDIKTLREVTNGVITIDPVRRRYTCRTLFLQRL